MTQLKPETWDLWRRQTLAQLATERAQLMMGYWGLSEAMLTTAVLHDQTTPKDLLAHIAYWDGLAADRLAKVKDGRLAELPLIGDEADTDQRNQTQQDRFKEAPLEAVWAVFLKERSGFLAALQRLPDALLHQPLTLPNGEATTPSEWVASRASHDADHAQTLHDWRQTLPKEQKRAEDAPAFILRGLLRAGRKELTAVSQLIPAAERNSRLVCGIWTLQDVIGHIVDWEKVALDGLQQLAAGNTPEFDFRVDDFAAFNQAHAKARAGQTWEQVWGEYETIHEQMMAAFDQMGEEGLKRPFTAPWGSPINGYHFAWVFAAHPREHAEDVRHALG